MGIAKEYYIHSQYIHQEKNDFESQKAGHDWVYPQTKTQDETTKTLMPFKNYLCKFLSGYSMSLFLTSQELV